MQGISGDRSTRYFCQGQDFGESKRIGHTIGEAVENILECIKYEKAEFLKFKKYINV